MGSGFFRLVAELTLLVLLLAAVGCGGRGATATPLPTPTPTPPPDPGGLLERAAGRVAAAESLAFTLEHIEGSAELAPGLLLTRAEGVANAPDSFRIALDLEASGSFLELEVIGIGERAWMTNLFSEEWESVVPEVLPVSLDNAAAVFAGVLAGVESPRLAGSERVEAAEGGGYAAWRIEGTLPGSALAEVIPGALAEASLAATVWVDMEENRLPRLQLDGPLLSGDVPEAARVLTLEERRPAAQIVAP